ncbi:MAG: vWA domain-containing protein [Bryobacteraceae bacterium]
MFLLNLSLAEFLTLFGLISGLVVALYLLDRSRRRLVVPTLQFWLSAELPTQARRRRKIQQPLSLLLQILSIALLLLGLAQLHFGARDQSSRDHVLLLETSAWMSAQTPGGERLIDGAKRLALDYLKVLPARDRVMVVRADALASPATAFESDRQVVESAIRTSEPGASALNLDQALEFAEQVRNLHARRGGEVVLVGSGRVVSHAASSIRSAPKGFRLLTVPGSVENVGLKRIGLRRPDNDPELWEIFLSVRNYGARPQVVPVALNFAGAPVGNRSLTVPPNSEQSVTFTYRTRASGWLEARLLTSDAFPADDRAVLELPGQRVLKVAIYTNDPHLLRPILTAATQVSPAFYTPGQYVPEPDADIVILDRFRPSAPPKRHSIWIQPPPDASPVTVQGVRNNVELSRWRTDHLLASGLRVKGVRLDSTQVYIPGEGDIVVAESEPGPVILARSGEVKTVALGFHPVLSPLRYELATPLLFANILRWMSPEIFRRWELNGGSVGTVDLRLEPEVNPASVRVFADNGQPVPFTIQDQRLRFFVGDPSTVRIQAGDREMVYSLTLPEVADSAWEAPAEALQGVPPRLTDEAGAYDLWRWLALAGALGLLVEWLLFGRSPLRRRAPSIRNFRPRWPPNWPPNWPWSRSGNDLRRAS